MKYQEELLKACKAVGAPIGLGSAIKEPQSETANRVDETLLMIYKSSHGPAMARAFQKFEKAKAEMIADGAAEYIAKIRATEVALSRVNDPVSATLIKSQLQKF